LGQLAQLNDRRVALQLMEMWAERPQPLPLQLDLFADGTPEEREQSALQGALDAIRRKRGFGAVVAGSAVGSVAQVR